jgi:hypothetical protein
MASRCARRPPSAPPSALARLTRSLASASQVVTDGVIYVNGHEYPVPADQPRLSAAAVREISARGPYTKPFELVVPILQPDRCRRFQDSLLERAAALLGAACGGGGGAAALSTRGAMVALLARPNADPGAPTYTVVMPPLLKCSTQSYEDLIRIVRWSEAHVRDAGRPPPLVLLLAGDGQSVLRMKDLKKEAPAEYKHVLVANGPFHSNAHLLFSFAYLWWNPLLGAAAARLGKLQHVAPTTYNLEFNHFNHHLQFQLAVAAAVMLYLQRHVTQPPLELLLRNPAQYAAEVQSAGGRVLVEFLRHAGLPCVFWQRAQRAMDGETLDALHAHAFHTFRAAHKTGSMQISLQHLLSTHATHDELQPFVREHLFVSPRGNVGASIGVDRDLENFNKDQKEQGTHRPLISTLTEAAADTAGAVRHAYRGWKLANEVGEPGDDGVRASMEGEIDVLVAWFVGALGVDLVAPTADNPFWVSGNPVRLAGGAAKERRPWEWIWAVADGRSAGGGLHECPADAAGKPWGEWLRVHLENMYQM